jgi:hypothetical protein
VYHNATSLSLEKIIIVKPETKLKKIPAGFQVLLSFLTYAGLRKPGQRRIQSGRLGKGDA